MSVFEDLIQIDSIGYKKYLRCDEDLFITLLLPIVIPYGSPYPATLNPMAHFERKAKFFRWIESVNDQSRILYDVPLIMSEDSDNQ